MEYSKKIKDVVKDYWRLTVGTLIVAFGIYFFKFPNNFSTGGVAGLAIVIPHLMNISKGNVTIILNMLFLVLGFLFFGRSFGFRTTYSSIVMSLSIFLFERFIPMTHPLTDQPVLELSFAVLLPAIGSAILFNNRASTGGTDILAMIVKKFTNQDIGNALFMSDILITISIFFVIDVKAGLFSVLGLLSKAMLVNNIIESFNMVKYFTIITDREEEIDDFITKKLGRGLTRFKGRGGFTGNEKTVILTVIKRPQAVLLRDFTRKTDPKAFIMITNTSQIVGKGFNYFG